MVSRVQIGKKGSEWGVWVSKPGANVQTCSADQLIFSSTDVPDMMTITQEPVGVNVANNVTNASLATLTDTEGSNITVLPTSNQALTGGFNLSGSNLRGSTPNIMHQQTVGGVTQTEYFPTQTIKLAIFKGIPTTGTF